MALSQIEDGMKAHSCIKNLKGELAIRCSDSV